MVDKSLDDPSGSASTLFPGFALDMIDLPQGAVRVRHGGSGPPLLLLHGNPQTHMMWHAVAPALARRFTVLCPDLRGYGQSFKPPASDDHAPYAKSAMAADMAELMTRLGHERFQIAAHDRGARVAHRLALDAPERVARLAVLDVVPALEQFERAGMSFAMGDYPGFWFAQPQAFPQELLTRAPETWFNAHSGGTPQPPPFFHEQALADYLRAAQDPQAIEAMCEDYRAAAGIDLQQDRISRADGRTIRCPMLVLWGAKGLIGGWYDPLGVWRGYCAAEVTGGPVEAGHYLAEEAPAAVIAAFEAFFLG